ncbi:MAG: hypothetical protein IT529_19070 [Burkholderiales bacterium]|nr:hypothetical protein [Burkholderiales bacterium]
MAIGFFLGYMHDLAPGKERWLAEYATGTHFEIRIAHAHGSLFGIINVAIGLLLVKLPGPPLARRAGSRGSRSPACRCRPACFCTPFSGCRRCWCCSAARR